MIFFGGILRNIKKKSQKKSTDSRANEKLILQIEIHHSNPYIMSAKLIKRQIELKFFESVEYVNMFHTENYDELFEIIIKSNKGNDQLIYSRQLNDPFINKSNTSIVLDQVQEYILNFA